MKFPPAIVGATALLALAVVGAVWWETRPGPPPEESASASADTPFPIPPLPPRIAQGEEYDHCLSLLASDPDDANDFAEAWSQKGGGDGATHCQALAKVALGDPEDGAQMMETLAANAKDAPSARAVMLRQA